MCVCVLWSGCTIQPVIFTKFASKTTSQNNNSNDNKNKKVKTKYKAYWHFKPWDMSSPTQNRAHTQHTGTHWKKHRGNAASCFVSLNGVDILNGIKFTHTHLTHYMEFTYRMSAKIKTSHVFFCLFSQTPLSLLNVQEWAVRVSAYMFALWYREQSRSVRFPIIDFG